MPVLTRKDVENGNAIEPIHDIRLREDGDYWTWGKRYESSYFDPIPKAKPDKSRETCPTSKPIEQRSGGTFSMCLVPLGTWVGETDDALELSELKLFKTRAACERNAAKRVAVAIPSCGSGP